MKEKLETKKSESGLAEAFGINKERAYQLVHDARDSGMYNSDAIVKIWEEAEDLPTALVAIYYYAFEQGGYGLFAYLKKSMEDLEDTL
jgi:predicted DCC family thiol-disulfide oxidoreductase YuxK